MTRGWRTETSDRRGTRTVSLTLTRSTLDNRETVFGILARVGRYTESPANWLRGIERGQRGTEQISALKAIRCGGLSFRNDSRVTAIGQDPRPLLDSTVFARACAQFHGNEQR